MVMVAQALQHAMGLQRQGLATSFGVFGGAISKAAGNRQSERATSTDCRDGI